MAGFSIDEVRGVMQEDVSGMLARIERAAGEALVSATFARPPDEGGDGLPLAIEAVAHSGHAIFGTASLVSADALAATAKLIEQVGEEARADAERARAHAERGRRLMELALEGVIEMRAILAHELAHDTDEAQWIALAWQSRVAEVLGAPVAVPPEARVSLKPTNGASVHPLEGARADEPLDADDDAWDEVAEAGGEPASAAPPSHGQAHASSDEEAFDFEDAETRPPAAAAAPAPAGDDGFSFEDEGPVPSIPEGVDQELREIFEQEVREALVALQGHLQGLSAEPSNTGLARSLERVYHTIKGASATVGMPEVSELAAELQDRVEGVVERGIAVTPAFLSQLVRDTNRLLRGSNLPQVTLATGRAQLKTSAVREDVAEARTDFVAEAAEICAEAQRALGALADATPAVAVDLRAALGRLFHRLKGSALVVGDEDVARQAARLEELCEESARPLVSADVTQLLSRVEARLGVGHARPREAPAVDEAMAGIFLEEARQIDGQARALLGELAHTAGSRSVDLQAELGRLFHRLKGSAAVVGRDAIAEEALKLQELCEAEPARPVAASELLSGLDRIGAELDLSPEEEEHSVSVAEAGPVRTAVEIASDPELWGAFTHECSELMDTIDRSILALEESASPKEQLRALFRQLHTLKGIVNTIGLAPTGQTLHRVEDFLEGLVDAPILPSMRSVATFLLGVQVEVRRNLKQAQSGYVETDHARLEARVAKLLAARHVGRASAAQGASERAPSEARRETGASARSEPWSEGSVDAGAADRRFIRISTERLDALMNLAGELVVSRSRLVNRVQTLRALQLDVARGSRRLVQTVDGFRAEHEFSNLDGRRKRTAETRATDDVATAAKPAWSSFGELELDSYEDIHILSRSLAEITSDFQEMYAQLSNGLGSLTDDSDAFGSIISGIQSEVTRARMVPVENLFARLRLPIRDAATRDAKEVRVVNRGEEVNLDKTLVDTLLQPMLHLVRNAVVHGIEAPREREARGKGPSGTITLAARQESGQIVIEVSDDGAGLDLAGLRARGAARGLVAPDVALEDPAVRDLVFAPGLSTRKTAGDVAGRGVGCDVVRRAVERVNGSIRVESKPGQGTTFIVTLPLTLAITKALLVRHGAQTFAVPLYFAERIVDQKEQEIVHSADVRRIKIDGAFLPLHSLGRFFGEREVRGGPVLCLRVGDQRVMVEVDAVLEQDEIVVKNMGELLHGHPLFAGVTIRGTGDLALIIDVPGLIEACGARVAPQAEAPRGTPAAARAVTARSSRAEPTPDSAAGAPAVSEPSNGTAPTRPEPSAEITSAPSAAKVVRPQVVRVLFVDDSLSVRKVAEKSLLALGVDVTLAVDGVDALAKLRTGRFDIVFTDLEMPRMHGYELIRELRFVPQYRDLPVVVVTSRSGQKHQDQARALGANEYITKPFTSQSLEVAIKRWTRGREPS